MTIELVLPFFDMNSSSFKKLVKSFRIKMFKEVATSKLEGMIFTYVWELDQKSDCDFVDSIVKIFEKEKANVYYVELEADIEERLKRNKSPHRLKHKPSKVSLKVSEDELLETDRKYVLNSKTNELHRKNYFKINNTKLNAKKTAIMIKERFNL